MPSGVIHEPKDGLTALWRRYKVRLFGASAAPAGKTPCPWCEGAGMLYDGKSGLVVYCDCCSRTGFITPPEPVPAQAESGRQQLNAQSSS